MSITRWFAVLVISLIGCASGPKSSGEIQSLEQRADATLAEMLSRDPTLRDTLSRSAGYAVFPSVGKGGMIIGGAYGEGILYEHGKATGTVQLSQASLGAQLGGETFAELLVMSAPLDVQRLRSGSYAVGGDVSAVALSAGAAASGTTKEGTRVFVLPRGGFMIDVSVNGQKLSYQPLTA